MTPAHGLDGLDQLIADARCMPDAMLPRPRRAAGKPRVIDLTATELTIPESAADLLREYADYGA